MSPQFPPPVVRADQLLNVVHYPRGTLCIKALSTVDPNGIADILTVPAIPRVILYVPEGFGNFGLMYARNRGEHPPRPGYYGDMVRP